MNKKWEKLKSSSLLIVEFLKDSRRCGVFEVIIINAFVFLFFRKFFFFFFFNPLARLIFPIIPTDGGGVRVAHAHKIAKINEQTQIKQFIFDSQAERKVYLINIKNIISILRLVTVFVYLFLNISAVFILIYIPIYLFLNRWQI